MSQSNMTSTEAGRLGEEEDDMDKKLKDFLRFSFPLAFALVGAKDLLIDKQWTFAAISISLIVLFGISSRVTRRGRAMTCINFAFLMLGCLSVGIAINSIGLNSFIKWVIYGMFIFVVAINPDYQQLFQEMKEIFKYMCAAASLRHTNLLIQSQKVFEYLSKINVVNQEQSSTTNNTVTQPVGREGNEVGEDMV